MACSEQTLRQLCASHEAWVLGQPGVCGLGIALGDDAKPVLEVLTHGIQPETCDRIRARLGVPVRFTESGEIKPL